MQGAYEVSLAQTLSEVQPMPVVSTAKGGSEMSGVLERVLNVENANLLSRTTIFWDGSHNGMTTVENYADELGRAIAALRHDQFVVIPPMHGGQRNEIAAEFRSRWPDNYLDWRDILGDYTGGVPSDLLAKPLEDKVHLGQTAIIKMARGIASFIRSKGWL